MISEQKSMLAEKQEIVRRVEGLFALADQLELRFAKARGEVDQTAFPPRPRLGRPTRRPEPA